MPGSITAEVYDVAHSLSGRLKKGSSVGNRPQGISPTTTTTISISEFLEIVNDTHRSILSQDVLDHYGETRPSNGYFTGRAKFSIKETDKLSQKDFNRTYCAHKLNLRGKNLEQQIEDIKTNGFKGSGGLNDRQKMPGSITICFMEEYKYLFNTDIVPLNIKKKIIAGVKAKYTDMEWKKGGFIYDKPIKRSK